ncbi:MAG: type III-A CRISPR-associated RAMP protein Csm5 [Candidatus Methanomethylicaceae archaeon]
MDLTSGNTSSRIFGKPRIELDLEVISPIHIGTREGRLGPTEFVWAEGRVYFIDEKLLAVYLSEKNLVDKFVGEVRRGPFKMVDFLKNFKLQGDLPRICAMSIPGGDPNMQDFRPFVRDASGTVFLPGTSLKGTFRTAILYRALKESDKLLRLIESKISSDPSKVINYKRKTYSEEELQRGLMENFVLPGSPKTKIPNTDILRCLTIRDAYPVSEVRTQVIQIKFLSKSGSGTHYWSQVKKGTPKDLGIWVECVTEGTFRLELIWDEKLYNVFKESNIQVSIPVKGIDDILESVKRMNEDLINHDIDFYNSTGKQVNNDPFFAARSLGDWYSGLRDDGKNVIRIGFGSGMLSTTVNLALKNVLRQKIRDACGSGPRPNDPAPKSRRVWRYSEKEVLPMGWLRWRVADPNLKPLPPEFSEKAAKKVIIEKPRERTEISRAASGQGSFPLQTNVETWETAQVRWNRGNDEVTASFEGKKATGKGRELLSEAISNLIVNKQKKGKFVTAKVTVEVISESYRRIQSIEISNENNN